MICAGQVLLFQSFQYSAKTWNLGMREGYIQKSGLAQICCGIGSVTKTDLDQAIAEEHQGDCISNRIIHDFTRSAVITRSTISSRMMYRSHIWGSSVISVVRHFSTNKKIHDVETFSVCFPEVKSRCSSTLGLSEYHPASWANSEG